MGLSIHYSGHLKNVESLPNLVEEIEDISKLYGWKYEIYNTHFPTNSFENITSFKNVYGISFTPTECETLSLVFLSNGAMVCPDRILFFSDDENTRPYIYTNSVKTQFAGVFIHQLLIRLFKYLNNKYFVDFKLSDESYYWETDDENLMRERFKVYDSLLDNFELSVQTFPIEPNEDMISYFERMMKHVDSLKKN